MGKRAEISARFLLPINTSPLLLTTEDKSPDILPAMPVFPSHDIQANYCIKQNYYQ